MPNDEELPTSSRTGMGLAAYMGLQAVAASLPYAGGLVQAWSDWESHRLNERIEGFFRDFSRQIEGNRKRIEAIDAYVRGSPEFSDLLEKTLRRISQETVEEKRRVTSVAFFNAIAAGPALSTDEKNNLLSSLDTLTLDEIACLKHFSQGLPVSLQAFLDSWVNPMADPNDQAEPAGKLAIEIAKLEGRGLIAETVRGPVSWSGDANHWVNRLRVKSYVLLPSGRNLLTLLNEN